ncbi:MAG: NUDIX domain-containing protein [Candidatus Paceibacterota bacterium]|jgi:hypothetical protein
MLNTKDLAVAGLSAFLVRHGISTDSWGVGNTKTPRHLLGEVVAGECVFARTEDGRLVREISVLGLDILRDGLVLEEDFQLFYEDNRPRKRKLDSSTGEKLLPGETPEQALNRLVEEEFPILRLQPKESFRRIGERFRESDSKSYPGLTTRYRFHFFAVELSMELPPITVQESDKLVAYKWVPRQG